MAEKRTREESLESFIDSLWAAVQEQFATGEVSSPILHFLTDNSLGVLPLIPLPGLDSPHMARLIVGLYDPPMAVVLAEGWAINLALPAEVDAALAGTRPWSEVSERVNKRVAPALRHDPALAGALRRGDVTALGSTLRQALIYAWHDAAMGPVMRGGKSLKDLPAHMTRKVLTLFGEDRDGHSQTRLWHIEQRDGRRHFMQESLAVASQYASSWRPLYLALEMAAEAKMPVGLIRPRVREVCREQLRAYKVVENVNFMEMGGVFGAPTPPYMQ